MTIYTRLIQRCGDLSIIEFMWPDIVVPSEAIFDDLLIHEDAVIHICSYTPTRMTLVGFESNQLVVSFTWVGSNGYDNLKRQNDENHLGIFFTLDRSGALLISI